MKHFTILLYGAHHIKHLNGGQTVKNKIINIRVTEKEKEELVARAKKEKMTVSMYLVQKGLAEKSGAGDHFLPEQVETIDFLNELWHRVQKCGSRELKADISELYQKAFDRIKEDETNGA